MTLIFLFWNENTPAKSPKSSQLPIDVLQNTSSQNAEA